MNQDKTVFIILRRGKRRSRKQVKIDLKATPQTVLYELGLLSTLHPFHKAGRVLCTADYEKWFKPEELLFDEVSDGQELIAEKVTSSARFPLPRFNVAKTRRGKIKKKRNSLPKEQLQFDFGNRDRKPSYSLLSEPCPENDDPIDLMPQSNCIEGSELACPLCGMSLQKDGCYRCNCGYEGCSY